MQFGTSLAVIFSTSSLQNRPQ